MLYIFPDQKSYTTNGITSDSSWKVLLNRIFTEVYSFGFLFHKQSLYNSSESLYQFSILVNVI